MSEMLKGWSDDHTARFQKEIITFNHGLNATGLFTDEALIELLEKHPANMLDVCTMGGNDHLLYPNKFRTGDFRDTDGKTLLNAAKAGKVWINLRRSMNVHPEYRTVLEHLYNDLANKTGNKAYNANGGILISSPVAQVPYHFDKTETILWHVRGKKRIYIYPRTEKFIPDHAYEASVLNELNDDLPYVPAFDAAAQVFDLEEDQAITWPLNSPHRVDNTAFCVSVTTEYSTRESAMKNAAMIANGTLRHRFGIESSYRDAGIVGRQLKSVFGHVIRKAGLVSSYRGEDMVSFKIDSSASDFIVDIPPYQRDF